MIKPDKGFIHIWIFLLILVLSSESSGIGLETEGTLMQFGVITEVNTRNKTFKVKDTDSNAMLPLTVDDKTKFKNISGLHSLKVGDHVSVEFTADIQLSRNLAGEIEAQLRKALAKTVEKVTAEVMKQRQESFSQKKHLPDKEFLPKSQ